MDRSQEINKPILPETTESACVLYLCIYCITFVIYIIIAVAHNNGVSTFVGYLMPVLFILIY